LRSGISISKSGTESRSSPLGSGSPELTLQPLSQSYTRIAKDTYRYESNTGFSAEIVLDGLGLVTAYPNGWKRIGTL